MAKSLRERNPLPALDGVVELDEADGKHEYTVNGAVVNTSTTRVVSQAIGLPDFDANLVVRRNLASWRRNKRSKYHHVVNGLDDEDATTALKGIWHDANRLGKQLHARLEAYVNGSPTQADKETDVEFESVKRAVDEAVATFGWSPYRAELSLFWTDSEGKPTVCGQADLLIKNKDGKLVIVDLKRTQHDLSRSKIPYGDVACAAPQLEHLYASDHARYSLQVSIYACMLKQRLGIVVEPEDRWLLQGHPSMPKAVWTQCRCLDAEAREILAGVKASGAVKGQ
jgi:hypothetical protein